MACEGNVKYNDFKQFDIVQHRPDSTWFSSCIGHPPVKKPSEDWLEKIEKEWRILNEDLPEGICVRVFEGRMDLLSAAIVGSSGTPYHHGLFFFDAYFSANYPRVPPELHYHSHGLRIIPNLCESGRVFLSTIESCRGGKGCERWNQQDSTMLQILVSIQALLNSRPFFYSPDPDYLNKLSSEYNKQACLLSCKTMLFSLRSQPKHFEDFVVGHFHKYGLKILDTCEAYLSGVQVGFAGVDDPICSEVLLKRYNSFPLQFRITLRLLFSELLNLFLAKGLDCGIYTELNEYLETLDKKKPNGFSRLKKCFSCYRG